MTFSDLFPCTLIFLYAQTGENGKEPIAIGNLDEYLNDLYTYKDKMEKHDNLESRECYKLVCVFLAFAKETGMTVMVEEE